ncbi:MAG TPA: DinB family protein [Nocardioidaceae bacterium]|jgi:hypothetical protein|nr:DinB family protein [Nocardioidaceae bacterium]
MPVEELLWFVDDCLSSMLDVVEGLGDDLANTRPELAGANSPYAILTHCLGVIDWWGGVMISGRQVVRDRDAEFVATGPVSGLREQVRRTRDRLGEDVRQLDPQAAPLGPVDEELAGLPYGRTRSAVLLHVFHELAQHLGQMEITRDLLVAGERSAAP